MSPTIQMLRGDGRARRFFLAHAQSSLGTGAGYVALLLVAYERFESPWAISGVLLADFLPAMLFGVLLGAAVDRWSRRWCAVVADLARGAAFIGLALVASIEATVGLALLAGAGAGLFGPAVLAGLPHLVEERRLPAATSLYGALADLGHTAGPGLAALVLLVASPEVLLVGNGVTFILSAGLLTTLPLDSAGEVPSSAAPRRSLITEAREGVSAAARLAGVRTLLLASSAVVVFAGMLNVGELLLARDLGAGPTGFSILVAVFGLGVAAGSFSGSRGGDARELERGFLRGLLAVGAGLLAAGAAPSFPLALAAFALTGYGNGLVVVHQRLLLQRVVPDHLMGRVFGLDDALGAWAFGAAFIGGAALVAALGTQPLFLIAGTGTVLVWAASLIALNGGKAGGPLPAPPATATTPSEVLAGSLESRG